MKSRGAGSPQGEALPRDYAFRQLLAMVYAGQWRDLLRLTRARALRKLRPGWRGPFVMLVEPTRRCKLNCLMCLNPRLGATDKGTMSPELFQRILDEVAAYRSLGYLIFTGLGEPLQHERLFEMTRAAKTRGVPRIRVNTNGTELNPDMVRRLARESQIDELVISLGAATETTYRWVRGAVHFDELESNIQYLLQWKRKQSGPFVRLKLLRMRETVSEISDFIRKWRPRLSRGDAIWIVDEHSFAGQVPSRTRSTLAGADFRRPCRQLWELLYVSWDGSVMPCCMDMFRTLRLGQLPSDSLPELWQGQSLEGLRSLHAQRRWAEVPLCKSCDVWWYLS